MTENIDKSGILKKLKDLAEHLLWFKSGCSAIKKAKWRKTQQIIVEKINKAEKNNNEAQP